MAAASVQLPPPPPQSRPLKLRANYGSPITSSRIGYLHATPASTPREELRRRFQEDGYVFIKGLLPRQSVLDMRAAYFSHMACTDLLEPGTAAEAGIFNSSQDPLLHSGVGGSALPEDLLKVEKLTSAHQLDIYEAFLAQDELRSWIRNFMGWEKEVMVVRNMLRHNVPEGLSTGIHYDRIFLRAGDADFLTAWIPIGDCGADEGGLTYLEGSTALGQAMEKDFMRRAEHMSREERINGFNKNMARDGQLAHNLDDVDNDACGVFSVPGASSTPSSKQSRWLVADYEAGDVVFHNPYLIHGACRNESKRGVIRLSSDVRFYDANSDLSKDERWMSYWRPDDGL